MPLMRLTRPELGLLQIAPRPLVEAIVRRVIPGAEQGWTAAGVDEFLRAYLTPAGRAAFYAAARHIYLDQPDGKRGFWPRLAELGPESLFVWGQRDRLVPIAFARHVEDVLPQARHLELDCGHVPQIERPRRTHRAIREFSGLRRASRSTSEPAVRRLCNPERVGYPVEFSVDYADSRSRLSAFFRLILAIPLLIWAYVYGILATIVVIIAWFAIVVTGRYPQGLYEFEAGWVRFLARVTAYIALLCDGYPSFCGLRGPLLPGADALPGAGALQPREDRVQDHPRDPDCGGALRDAADARDGSDRGLVRDRLHRQHAAGAVRPDGARQLIHRPLRRLLAAADRDLPPFQDEQTRSAGEPGPPAPPAPPVPGPS